MYDLENNKNQKHGKQINFPRYLQNLDHATQRHINQSQECKHVNELYLSSFNMKYQIQNVFMPYDAPFICREATNELRQNYETVQDCRLSLNNKKKRDDL